MTPNRSLGGIGRLYRDNDLLGEVYYNIAPEPQKGLVVGSIVPVGVELHFSGNICPYLLVLEDGRYMVMTLARTSSMPYSAWSCASHDGICTPERARAFSYLYPLPRITPREF